MKFSHSVQFNAVPEWSSNYINYSNLKKLFVNPFKATSLLSCLIVTAFVERC